MIRFKVVKASRILLIMAFLLLAAVAALILITAMPRKDAPARQTSASLVEVAGENGAKTESVFAPAILKDVSMRVEVVGGDAAVSAPPSVLIYHTHTHEAYEPVKEDPYEAVEAWRTADMGHSVVRVGTALAEALEARGFAVTHDVTDHETEALSTAYTRSLQTLEGYDSSFDLYIDLHRDAYIDGMALRYEDSNGRGYAQPMLLIGNGKGFESKPFYRENLAFAKALTDRINDIKPGLCRPVLVKDGRYNQHIGIFAVLIEVGHNRNTLREALNTAPVIADALQSLMIDHPDEMLSALQRARESAQ